MPRKRVKISSREIQIIRGNWYEFHFNMRKMAEMLDKATIKKCKTACMMLPRMTLGVMGGIPIPERYAFVLANQIGVDVDLLNDWYLTPGGWDDFQVLWKSLPEPFDVHHHAYIDVGESLVRIDPDDDQDLQAGRRETLQ